MQSLFTWIAYGLGTLFFGACVVAWWEHLGRDGQRAQEPDWETPPGKAASVDVELDALPVAAAGTPGSPAAGDVGERRQALGGAMTRMASGSSRQAFGDTVPMILAGGLPPSAPDADQAAANNAAPEAAGQASGVERRQRDRATAND
jgi:hypothetical protein